MRTRLFVFVTVALLLRPALSNAGFMGIFPTSGSSYTSSCNLVETGSGLRSVAVVITGAALINSYLGVSHLRIDSSSVPSWIPLSVTSPFTLVGSASEFSISFGSCLSVPLMIATANYLDIGGTPCGTLYLGVTFSVYEGLVRCDGTEEPTGFGRLTINGVNDVPPGAPDPDCYCPTVATEPATWSKVKALYRK